MPLLNSTAARGFAAAFALASLLSALALVTLVVKAMLERRLDAPRE